jgi:hypothetical protein
MKTTSSLFYHLIILSFVFNIALLNAREHPTERERAVSALMDRASKILSKKYSMKTVGISISMPGGVVKELGLEFEVRSPFPLEALRKQLIESGNDFLSLVNADQALKTIMEVYPFGIERIEIVFFLVDKSRYPAQLPEIGIAQLREGRISYEWYLQENNMPELKKDIRESYEEACKALQSS